MSKSLTSSTIILTMIMTSLLAFGSCRLAENFEEIGRLSMDLKEEFNHDDISTSFSIDNDVKHWAISFTSFDMDDLEYSELKRMAEDVYDFAMDETDGGSKQDYILVVFTPEFDNDDDTTEKVEFRFDN